MASCAKSVARRLTSSRLQIPSLSVRRLVFGGVKKWHHTLQVVVGPLVIVVVSLKNF